MLLLGVDRFMSEARAITNTIGNAVGTMAISRWVGALDMRRATAVLNGETESEDMQALYGIGSAATEPEAEMQAVPQAAGLAHGGA